MKGKSVLTSEKDLWGFRMTDLLGIVIMIIPFVISIRFIHIIPAWRFLFVRIGQDKVINIRPNLISALCAVVFYAALIARYDGIFRAKNLIEAMISIARAFLNCWVIASLVSLVIPTTISDKDSLWKVLTNNPESTMLLFAVILSWLGMKTIAGYSWILFILATWKHLLLVNGDMGMWGAVFVLAFAISLFLQLEDYSILKEFAQEFRGKASHTAGQIREEMNAALSDASSKAHAVGSFVKENVSAYTPVKFPTSSNDTEQANGVKINLESLDLNKDGVVDEKDFLLLNQNKK